MEDAIALFSPTKANRGAVGFIFPHGKLRRIWHFL
jgi:hypothetical protein